MQSGLVDAAHLADTVRLARVTLPLGEGGLFLVLDPVGNINYDTILFRMTVFGELQ